MSTPMKKEMESYNYADYCEWDDNGRWELIEGVPYAMAPAPNRRHQEIVGILHVELFNFLKGKMCQVFVSPFDVRLNADQEDDTVVQPDLLVICDPEKLDDKGCKGAPDLIIEILSPATAKYDRLVKFNQYQKARVKEYWMVDPETETVQVCVLGDRGQYEIFAYGNEDRIPVQVLSGCEINLQDVFPE